ncbi:MAG: DNA (cytosine-5-)-methyltransferase [Mycoplasma sp.]|nr:DNA (cytosine-5-)-methyltransferase [Mycoplasma sp.]
MEKTKVNSNKKQKIKVFETFAGIGAQHKAIKNINDFVSEINLEVIGTSEWDVRAMIAYSQIHKKSEFDKKYKEIKETWDEEKVNNYFNEKVFSLNSKKPSFIRRKSNIFKMNVIAANEVNNNTPDINKISAEDIINTDLLTYSFPCQGLSIANMGRGKGIKVDADSTSNLIWQIKRLLDDVIDKKMELPKYLLLENVTSLIGKSHIEDYNAWKNYLDSIGYKTFTMIFSGLDHSSIQDRKRVFAISIKKEFLTNFNLTESDVQKEINGYGSKLSLKQRKEKYKSILSTTNKEYISMATPNNTSSRKRMSRENATLNNYEDKNKEYIFRTLTTKQDRHPNIGMIKLKNNDVEEEKLNYRFITPEEGYQIMGFSKSDYKAVHKKLLVSTEDKNKKEKLLTKESLYRQAGNSIVVQVLESIFKFIKKFERGDFYE